MLFKPAAQTVAPGLVVPVLVLVLVLDWSQRPSETGITLLLLSCCVCECVYVKKKKKKVAIISEGAEDSGSSQDNKGTVLLLVIQLVAALTFRL